MFKTILVIIAIIAVIAVILELLGRFMQRVSKALPFYREAENKRLYAKELLNRLEIKLAQFKVYIEDKASKEKFDELKIEIRASQDEIKALQTQILELKNQGRSMLF